MSEAARTKVLFILGSQRGGTTLLGRLLGEVEGFVFAGEVGRLWRSEAKQVCGCGEHREECPLWSPVMAKVLAEGRSDAEVLALQRRRLSVRHSWLQTLRMVAGARRGGSRHRSETEYDEVAELVYREVAEVSGARVVVDSAKHPNEAVLVSRLPGVSSYFVQIVRDPRGSAYSVRSRELIRRSRRGEDASHRHWRGIAYPALNWLTRHLAAEVVRRFVGPGRSLQITYEELIADPPAVLGRLAAMVGEAPEHLPSFDGGKVQLGTAHSPGGEGRFPPMAVTVKDDRRWVEGLSRPQAVLTGVLTWPLMARYRYPFRRPRPEASSPPA